MSATPKISVRGLRKSFGPKLVLDGIDLDVVTGESLVVIGGSGTGKSVMVKCILGLLEPDAGSIKIDGQEVVGMPTSEREKLMGKFGMLFQGAALFDSMTVSTIRNRFARSVDPVSVTSTMASARTGGLTSVAPHENSTFTGTPCRAK